MSAASGRLLIVDDNVVDREQIRRLVGVTFETMEAATAAEAVQALEVDTIDCVLLDYRLPDQDGIAIIERLSKDGTPVVMLTSHGDESLAVEAMKRGASDYLPKGGLDANVLRRAITSALEKGTLRRRIEEQQRALEAHVAELAAREAELRMILEQLPAMLWTADEHLRYTSFNGATRFALAEEGELIGAYVGDLVDGDLAAGYLAAHRAALSGQAAGFELEWRDRYFRGQVEPLLDAAGEVRGVIGVSLDMSATRALEQKLRRAQKMEALGNLAGGVAHDFNNLLTAIISFAGFLREELPPGSEGVDDVDEIRRAADRGAGLVKQLLAFSQRQMTSPRVVDVRQVVSDLFPMLRRVLGEDVELALSGEESVWPVEIDPVGLEQIVVNMAVNARDAMPRGGRIVLDLRNVALIDGLPLRRGSELAPGQYVVLSISDEGVGIPQEIQERVFEPFYTTKPVGSGTGLGLATCYGIAHQAGGTITLYSEVEHGTTFKVYLPMTAAAAGPPAPATPEKAAGGDETILVLEDDAQVRSLVVRTLALRGYDVLEATNADDAEAMAAEHGARIRLVLTDVVMPGASGPVVVERIRHLVPHARILYMSGYAHDVIRSRGLLDASAPMLEKPFTPESLASRVRSVLDQD